jgi:hypothetical protein
MKPAARQPVIRHATVSVMPVTLHIAQGQRSILRMSFYGGAVVVG